MNDRELRRRCRRELHDLEIEPPLRVDVLCERLGQQRGRPIRLVPHPLPVPGPFGLWLATARTDYVFYQSEATRVHQEHIILHEVAHILANHERDDADSYDWSAALPDLSPRIVSTALARTCYDAEREREAEMIATIIMSWASRLGYAAADVPDTGALRQLKSAFGNDSGWR